MSNRKKSKASIRSNSWPKIRMRKVQIQGKSYHYWSVDCGMIDGKRVTKNFKTQTKAQRWAEKKRIEHTRIGMDASRLTDEQKRQAVKAFKQLAGVASLIDAVEFFLVHNNPPGGRRSVNELLSEYLVAKDKANRRAATLLDIRHRIGKLAVDYGDRPVHEITTHDLEKWLDDHGYRKTTRANFKRLFTGFFNYALKHKLVKSNPAVAIEKPIVDEKIPQILTPTEVEQLMFAALGEAPEIVPYFAIAIFDGIRPAELQQLDWANIDLTSRRIKVVPETAKRRRQRYVDISDNLLKWLAPYRRDAGLIHYSRKDFDLVRAKAGVKWSHDICRHTYGSYHLAMHDNAALTSLQMGHHNTDILFQHYRDIVTREDAKRFWNICPGKAQIIPFVSRQFAAQP